MSWNLPLAEIYSTASTAMLNSQRPALISNVIIIIDYNYGDLGAFLHLLYLILFHSPEVEVDDGKKKKEKTEEEPTVGFIEYVSL